jgi:hypothetical protein
MSLRGGGFSPTLLAADGLHHEQFMPSALLPPDLHSPLSIWSATIKGNQKVGTFA